MTKRETRKLEITESSGNVFADLELRHPESLMRKSTLLIEIELEIRRLGICRKVAAARMNVPEQTLANIKSAGSHQKCGVRSFNIGS